MTTGIMFFMSNSGDRTPIAIIPFPAIAVPYAPPRSGRTCGVGGRREKMNDDVRKKGTTCVPNDEITKRECQSCPYSTICLYAASAGHCGSPMLVGPRAHTVSPLSCRPFAFYVTSLRRNQYISTRGLPWTEPDRTTFASTSRSPKLL